MTTLDSVKSFRLRAECMENYAHNAILAAEKLAEMVRATRDKLREATQFYLDFGVAVASEELVEWTPRYAATSAVSYFRELAQELKRPLALVEWSRDYRAGEYVSLMHLSLRRNKRTENLVAQFMLIAEPYSKYFAGAVADASSAGMFRFVFIGDEGRALLDAWLERCRTDPVFRIVLRG